MQPGVSIPLTGKLAALFRVPIDYVLEVRRQGKIMGAISVPNYPGGLSLTQPHATSVRHTLGEEPVREATSNRARQIVIRGNSGQRARAGYNELGEVIFAEGPIILREFQAFLDRYQRYVATYPDITLVFRAFTENLNYRCEVGTWTVEWDEDITPLANWTLTLNAYMDAASNDPINLLSPVSDYFEKAAEKIQLMNAYLAIAGNSLTNFRGDLESLRAPLHALQQSSEAAGLVVDAARGVLRFPADVVADIANAATAFKNAWDGATGGRFGDPIGEREWDAIGGEWESMRVRLGYAAEDSGRDAMTALGFSGGGPDDLDASTSRATAGGPMDGHRQRPPSRGPRRDAPETTAVQMRPQETLRDLAQRFYNDPDQWIVIAEYNGWQNAHRLGSGRPARRGDWVLVPRWAVSERLLLQSDPYMRDLYLTEDGDLEMVGQGDAGLVLDLRTIRGPANLEQALTGRMLTAAGESSGFPEYGLPRIVGAGSSSGLRSYVASHVRDQLFRDPRIDRVWDLEVLDEGDRLTAGAKLSPKDAAGSPVTLLAPLPPAA
jgi:hypothetical protein